jgi:hypothetical protein
VPRDTPFDAVKVGEMLRAELARMSITQAWLCAGERPMPRTVAYVLYLLSLLHDQDARAEEAHVEWLIGLLNAQVKPTDASEAHVAWLLHLIVHGTALDADAPVSKIIAARSPYLKRKRRTARSRPVKAQ